MLFLELAFQGVRNLPATQVKLQPACNTIVLPPGGPAALAAACLDLLFGVEPLRAGATGPQAQGAVTLADAAQQFFHLARELASGRPQLLSYRAESQSFVPSAEEASEVVAQLRGLALGERASFEAAFLLRPEQLPSRRASAPSAAAGDEEARRRLGEIKAQLATASAADGLEFELDGVTKQKFAIEDALKALPDEGAELSAAQAQAARFAAVPADLAARYRRYGQLRAKRDEDLARWHEEHERLTARTARSPAPLAKSYVFWGGLLLGAVALAVGLLLRGKLRYIAWGDIPAFGVAAALGWRALDARDKAAALARRVQLSEERGQKIRQRDAAEIEAVESLLEALGLGDADEVARAVALREQAQAALSEAQAAHAGSRTSVQRQALLDQRRALEAKIAGLEEQLLKLNAGMSLAALRHEAAALEAQLAHAPSAAPGDPSVAIHEVTRAALDLWLVEAARGAERLSATATPAVQSLSGGRFAALAIGPAGVTVRTGDGREAGLTQLSAAGRDLVYLALRAGLVAGCEARARMPVLVVDDGAAAWPPALLGELGRGGQVLQFVTDAARAPAGSHVTRVGP